VVSGRVSGFRGHRLASAHRKTRKNKKKQGRPIGRPRSF
jgi:hypothetical protein